MLLPIKINLFCFRERKCIMKKISKKELKNILEKHKKWLMNEKDGKRANLSYTDLSNADLNYAELQYADLNYAALGFADLNHANLAKANLYHANLQFAELRFANLAKADLSNANLQFSELRFANLTSADLSEANLSGANLTNAGLSNANLEFANLTQAKLPKQIIQIGPIGSRKSYTIINVDDDIITCGCWKGSLEEFKARIDEVYPDDGKYRAQYLGVISLVESLRSVENA